MIEKPLCIFVVDDDPVMRMILVEQLQGHDYHIHEFASGPDCFAAMDEQPDLILLDIEMPEQTGLELCKEIRDNDYDDVQIVFVTGHDDLDTLLAVFNVGGNDLIPKNSPKEVLLRKVQTAIDAQHQKYELKKQLNYARKTAFTAMSSLGETGIVLEFLRGSFNALTLNDIGDLLLLSLEQFGLKGLIKVFDGDQAYFCCSDGLSAGLGISILGYSGKLGRITQKGDRLALNFPHVNLLALELDVEDVDGIGRLRDHLAIIAEGAGVRVEAMAVEQQRLRDAEARLEAIKEFSALLEEIEERQTANHRQLETLTDSHRLEMESAFINLGLTDSQELLLHGIVEHLHHNLEALFNNDSELALRLSEIIYKQKALIAV